MFNAIYKFKAYQFNVQTVLTNKTWTDAYRGAGRPGGDVRDRADHGRARRRARASTRSRSARRTGSSTTSSRSRRVRGLEYDSGNYEAATARAKEMLGLRRAAGRAEAAPGVRRHGPARHRRLDVHRDVRARAEPGAGQPQLRRRRLGARERADAGHRQGRAGHRRERARAGPRDGRSARSWPTGSACPFEDVEVLHGDTQVAHKGLDTYGSRSLVIGGEAIVRAVDKVIEKAKPIAAHLLEAQRRRRGVRRRPVQRAGHRPGHDASRRSPSRRSRRTTTRTGIGARHRRGGDVRPGQLQLPPRHAPVRHGGRHRDRRGEDAEVRLLRRHRQHHEPADRRGAGARRRDPGHRAGALGGGGVRRRRARWCPGRSWTTCCPPSADTISYEVDHTTSPSLTNSLGAKGVGEAGTIASTPAVVNAVVDAIRHLGINDIRMPCTPERVWKAINSAGGGGDAPTGGRGDAPLRRGPNPATSSTEGAGQ